MYNLKMILYKKKKKKQWKVLHVCNPTFGTGLASTLNLFTESDRENQENDFTSEQVAQRTLPQVCALQAQRGAPHLAGGSSDLNPTFLN